MPYAVPSSLRTHLRRAVVISLFVGSILVLINHGDHLEREPLCMHFELKALLSYVVPFIVSLVSSALADTQQPPLVGQRVSPTQSSETER